MAARNEELQDYDLLRIGALEQRVAELEKSNFSYALQLYNICVLKPDDKNYVACKELVDAKNQTEKRAYKTYVDELDAQDYEEGDAE